MLLRLFPSLAILLSVLAFCAVCPAQTTTDLLRTDAFSCFSMSAPSPSSAYGTLTLVDVAGQSFPRAFHVKTIKPSTNAWDVRIRCFSTTVPVVQNDTGLATFWMRTTSSASGKGYTTFVVEKGADPWTKSVSFTVEAGADWKKVQIPFSFAETYTTTSGAGSYNFSFWVNFDPQEIEIGGLTILDYGLNYPYADLNLENWPYEGHALDAAWRKDADERIERIRKADIAVIVRDDEGKPVPGAQVHVKMKRHAFGFGSAVAGSNLTKAGTSYDQYREMIPKLFNKVVLENDLKWPFWESWPRDWSDYALNWLPQQGISMVRGHNVIWPNKSNLPADVGTLIDLAKADASNKDALRKRISDHIREIVTFTKGRVTEWDVLNEPYTSHDIQDVLGKAEMAEWFKQARAVDPDVKLYLNDFSITESGGLDFAHQNALASNIQIVLDNGGPLDAIGLQSHFDSNLTAPTKVYEILDRFAAFGKDLQVTEFDVNVGDEQVQADYLRDYLTVCFSHPAMKGFMLWGFWEGSHWLPKAAMYRTDWTIKPNGKVWNDLIFNKWWTDVQGTTDANGAFHTRGFLGDYDVEITAGGQTKTLPLTAVSGKTNYVSSGKQVPGAITVDGVTNAASYAKGAVTPGEVVAIFGSAIGSVLNETSVYDASNVLGRNAGDTRVLFDGVPAPMVYSTPGQLSAIVPYAVSGTTVMQVEHQGVLSNAISVPVAPAIPGVFTKDMTGSGAAVAFNITTGLPISPENPIGRGPNDSVMFFMTGEGQTDPPGVDGAMPVVNQWPKPAQPITVTFGGIPSDPASTWAGQTFPGVLQLNVKIPAGAPVGPAVPLVVKIGNVSSQAGVTIAIR